MKTKLFFIASFLFIFSSCIKDYHGGGPEKIEFTEKNYVYEGELYRIYLNGEIEVLDKEIKVLENILANNQGNEKTEQELALAKNQREVLKGNLSTIIPSEQVAIRLPPPPPPCPIPSNCDFSGLEYILTPIQTEKIRVLFLDDKDNIIGGGTFDELSPLPEAEGQISFSRLMIGEYDSPVIKIRVEATNFDKTVRTYELP